MDSAPRDGTLIDLLVQWSNGSFTRWTDVRWLETGPHGIRGWGAWQKSGTSSLDGIIGDGEPIGWMRVALPDFAKVPADA